MFKIKCIATDEIFEGELVGEVRKCIKMDGTLLEYWMFGVLVDGKKHLWECHSDYWELIDARIEKVSKALKLNESQESNILDKLKNILKWGFCK